MTINKNTIIKKEVKWQGNYLTCSVLTYRDKNGIERQWECVDRIEMHGISVIVPFTKDNEVIVIKQFRPPLNGYVIEFPAGLCEKGEDITDSAKRELLEETGYGNGEFIIIDQGPVAVSSSNIILTVFLAKNVEYLGSPGMDANEDIEALKIPFTSFYETVKSFKKDGVLIDLKLYGFFELAKMS